MYITTWNIQNKPLGLFCTHKNSTVTAPAIVFKNWSRNRPQTGLEKQQGQGGINFYQNA